MRSVYQRGIYKGFTRYGKPKPHRGVQYLGSYNSARPEGKGRENSFQSLEKGSHNKSSRLQWSDTATQKCSDVTLPSTSDLLLGFSIAKPKCKLRRARELIDEVPTGQPPQAESRTERDKIGYRGNKERYVVET